MPQGTKKEIANASDDLLMRELYTYFDKIKENSIKLDHIDNSQVYTTKIDFGNESSFSTCSICNLHTFPLNCTKNEHNFFFTNNIM